MRCCLTTWSLWPLIMCFAIIVPFTDRIPIPSYVAAGVLKIAVYKLILFYIVEDFGLIGFIA